MASASPLPAGLPLDEFPVAAAGLDLNGAILVANRRFCRLFHLPEGPGGSPHLRDLVGTDARPLVERALERLGSREGCRRRRVIAAPFDAEAHPLALDIMRDGARDGFSYLVLARPVLRRSSRRGTAPPEPAVLPGLEGAAGAGAPPWVTTLAHELRGSLAAIHGWAAMAERGVLPAGGLARALRIIRRNAESLTTLVETVLDLSRIARGTLALALEPVDLGRLVAHVVESTYPAARARAIVLTLDSPGPAAVVAGDPLRLEQVFRNLVENAIKFTPEGGTVRVRTRREDGFVECAVEDTGVGIPADRLPGIFDPAQRGAPTPSSGTGLGLALVRELVRLHHGEIRAASRGVGQGSTFSVRLPLGPPERMA